MQRTMNFQDNIYADEQKQILVGTISAQFDSANSAFFVNLQVLAPELREQYKDLITERYRTFYDAVGDIMLESKWDLIKDEQ